MPIAFLAPLALAALGLAAVPVVVHMLRRARARRVEFPSLRFLRETPSIVRTLASPDRKALLALRVGAVALAALALARPVWVGGPGAGALETERALVLLLDASASMRRLEARDAAVAAARAALAGARPGDRVRVGVFAASLEWLGPAGTAPDAAAALERYRPGFGPARPAAALEEAARELRDAPQRERTILLVSDFQRSNGPWGAALDPSVTLEPVAVGNDFENAFVSGVAVEPTAEGARVRAGTVVARGGERTASVVALPLEEGAAAEGVRLERDGAAWRLVATSPDAFDADDAHVFVAPARRDVAVADPGAARPYLAAAAGAALPGANVAASASLTAERLAGASAALVTQRALAAEGAAAALERWVREGNEAVVFATEPVEWPFPRPAAAANGAGLVARAPGAGDTLERALVGASLAGARAVAAEPGDEPVLASGADAVAVRRRLGAGAVTVVGFDPAPERAPFVRSGAFPLLVEWLLGAARARGYEVGDPAVAASEPGVVAGEAGAAAVNVPAAESEPGALSAEEIAAAVARTASSAGRAPEAVLVETERRQGGWRFALAAALGLVLVELAAVSRRRSA